MKKQYTLNDSHYTIDAKKVSPYGVQHGVLDYGGLASLVRNKILANSLDIESFIEELPDGSWIEGYYDFLKSEEMDEDEYSEYEYLLDALQSCYQWYLVDDYSAKLLQDLGEIVLYSDDMDLNLWCIFHYGTSWDYVLTDIELKEV